MLFKTNSREEGGEVKKRSFVQRARDLENRVRSHLGSDQLHSAFEGLSMHWCVQEQPMKYNAVQFNDVQYSAV